MKKMKCDGCGKPNKPRRGRRLGIIMDIFKPRRSNRVPMKTKMLCPDCIKDSI